MKTVLHTKVDKNVKEEAQALAEELGVPLSTVINSHLKEFVKSGTLVISREPRLKESVWKEILKISKDARKGKGVSPLFDNVDEAMAWLES